MITRVVFYEAKDGDPEDGRELRCLGCNEKLEPPHHAHRWIPEDMRGHFLNFYAHSRCIIGASTLANQELKRIVGEV